MTWVVAVPPSSEVFHTVSIWLVRCQLRRFVRLLVPWYALVCKAPAASDRDFQPR